MRKYIGLVALIGAACGGETRERPAGPPSGGGNNGGGAAPVRPVQPATTGTIHEVRMELTSGKYLFTPATLTIKRGDVVRWINISGWPHNVQFKKDRVPAGAQPVLNAAMPDRLSDLTGPFLTDTLAAYVVSFADAPTGSYSYACQPHEVMGMVGALTVAP